MQSILFLDFDGVIVTDTSAARGKLHASDAMHYSDRERGHVSLRAYADRALSREHIARVNAITDATGAAVVLVTSWMRYAELDVMREILRAAGLTGDVIDESAGIRFSGNTRCMMTVEYLEARPDVTRWCVLDDDARAWQRAIALGYGDRIVSPRDGVTDEDVALCIAALNRDALSIADALAAEKARNRKR